MQIFMIIVFKDIPNQYISYPLELTSQLGAGHYVGFK